MLLWFLAVSLALDDYSRIDDVDGAFLNVKDLLQWNREDCLDAKNIRVEAKVLEGYPQEAVKQHCRLALDCTREIVDRHLCQTKELSQLCRLCAQRHSYTAASLESCWVWRDGGADATRSVSSFPFFVVK